MSAILGNPVAMGAAGSGGLDFYYQGDYTEREDGVVELRSSGLLSFRKKAVIDLFLVGGGGAAGTPGTQYGGQGTGSGGGGGGYTATYLKIEVNGDINVVIGSGGVHVTSAGTGGDGGVTSFGSYSVNGGKGSTSNGPGANGGSGGGGQGHASNYRGGIGGSNGGNGNASYQPGGTGQGTTTREFGEATGKLYAGGGSGANVGWGIGVAGGDGGGGAGSKANENGSSGTANTGGGGGGGSNSSGVSGKVGGDGGSGIVCFRLSVV